MRRVVGVPARCHGNRRGRLVRVRVNASSLWTVAILVVLLLSLIVGVALDLMVRGGVVGFRAVLSLTFDDIPRAPLHGKAERRTGRTFVAGYRRRARRYDDVFRSATSSNAIKVVLRSYASGRSRGVAFRGVVRLVLSSPAVVEMLEEFVG